MQRWFEVVPTEGGWGVRDRAKYLGFFHTQEEAFRAAVEAARKAHADGSMIRVRVVRPDAVGSDGRQVMQL